MTLPLSDAAASMAIVGSGSIGVSWAIVFARAGRGVCLHDTDPQRLRAAGDELRTKLDALAAGGLLVEEPREVAARVTSVGQAERAVARASYVQECVPEDLRLKQALLSELAGLAPDDCVFASSSSALMPSQIFAGLPRRSRALVVHPANPPHLLPIVEVVPAPFTEDRVIVAVEALLTEVGMSPVRLAREIEGFVLNRLQGAVLREAYALVRDGITDVDGVDRVMRDGLGRRWAVAGPFETSDLNTRGGVVAHARRMGPAYERMGAERGQHDPWPPELVASVDAQRRAQLPLEQWEERVAWRDEQLILQERARRGGEPVERAARTSLEPSQRQGS